MAIDREGMQRHLARSRAVQRRVVHAAMAIAALALVMLIVGVATRWWLGAAALAAIVGGSGIWITQGHIADFDRQLNASSRQIVRRRAAGSVDPQR